MKKRLYILVTCSLLLCAAGCTSAAPADELPTPGLPIIEVAPEDLDAKLDELSGGAQEESGLWGYPIRPGYLADLNRDGKYELYMNLCFGSGIVDERVQCYDPATGQVSVLGDRMITDYVAVEYEGVLYIIARPYEGGDATVCKAALTDGALACEDINAELQKEMLEAQAD
jgi:hypothetical protein